MLETKMAKICLQSMLTMNLHNNNNLDRKSTTKVIALVVKKIDYMLQERQIVIQALGNQIDIEDPAYTKYYQISFQSIVWILISVNVTIYRTVPLQRYQNSHCIIITTTKLRSCI